MSASVLRQFAGFQQAIYLDIYVSTYIIYRGYNNFMYRVIDPTYTERRVVPNISLTPIQTITTRWLYIILILRHWSCLAGWFMRIWDWIRDKADFLPILLIREVWWLMQHTSCNVKQNLLYFSRRIQARLQMYFYRGSK